MRDVVAIAYHIFAEQAIPHVTPLYRCKAPADFERDLLYLKSYFRIVSHDEIVAARVKHAKLPSNAVALSFDDGFAECFSVVRPLLLAHGVPATFFVCKSFVGNRELMYRNKVALCLSSLQGRTVEEKSGFIKTMSARFGSAIKSASEIGPWLTHLGYGDQDKIDAACECLEISVPEYLHNRRPYMTDEQISRLHEDGFTIGAHSTDHPHLAQLRAWVGVRQQISDSCDFVREITGRRFVPFAFPFNGLTLPRTALAELRHEYQIDLMYDTNGLMRDRTFVVNRIFCDNPLGVSRTRSNLPALLLQAHASEPLRVIKRLSSVCRSTHVRLASLANSDAVDPIAPLEHLPTDHGKAGLIKQNFFWLSSAPIALQTIGLITGVYARRVLQPAAIGRYSWCVSILSYFSLLINPGLETIAKRDVARDRRLASERFSQLLSLKLLFTASAYCLIGLFIGMRLRPQIDILLMASAVGLLLISLDPSWLLQAQDRMAPAGIGQIVSQLLWLPALFLLVHEPADVVRYAVLRYPFDLGLIVYLLSYAYRQGFLRWSNVRLSLCGSSVLLKEALPIGLSQIAILLYYNFDVILLGLGAWRNDQVVGLYSTAYRVMLLPLMFSGALSSAYFPTLSRVRGDERRAAQTGSEFLRALVWIGMPLAAVGWAFGRNIIVLLYGHEFEGSGPLLEWLCLNLALIFFNVGIGNPLDAWGYQVSHFRVSCVGAVVNVLLNLLLIPRYGAWAAVATTLLAEVAVCIGCILVRRNRVPLPLWSIIKRPLLLSLSAAVAGKYLVLRFPDQWLTSIALVTSILLVACWLCERDSLIRLWQSFAGQAQTTEGA